MRDRGIVNPEELLGFASAQAILTACRWWDTQRSAGAGVLAKLIRDGGIAQGHPALDDQQQYGEQIIGWLAAKMPALGKLDARIVEWERKLYGEQAANELARSITPHPAAIAAVIRLHHEHGRGSLTLAKHGPMIRAAVKASDKEALADYKAIAKGRQAP